jgi:hypothetical protein
MADWYPKTLAALIPWHENFAAQAIVSGTSLGLTAAQVTQINADKNNVLTMLSALEQANSYRAAITEFKDLLFNSPADTPTETPPSPPDGLVFPGVDQPVMGIEARTREYAAIIKASPAYSPDDGVQYGIVGTAPAPPSTPTLEAFALTASQVRLRIGKKGYAVLAVDSRRGGGDWEQIGVSMLDEFIDTRAPLAPGEPELREFRVQGMVENARVGDYSEVATVSTVP